MQLYSESHRVCFENELVRRIGKNPRYSMRAFAKSLNVSHTVLSLVMAGKRPASRNLLTRFADNVGLPPDEKAKLVESGGAKGVPPKVFRKVDLDLFSLIADWYHYAILSLLDIPGACFDANWIAARLGIAPIQAKAAMDRLLRLNLIAEKNGVMKQTGASLKFENVISTGATRKFHHDLLTRAQQSLDNDPIDKRDFSSMTFSMDESLVPLARDRIRAFRRKLMAELTSQGKPTKVFNLTVQIYPVSK